MCDPGLGGELFSGQSVCSQLYQFAPFVLYAIQIGIPWSMTVLVFRDSDLRVVDHPWIPHVIGASVGVASIGGWSSRIVSVALVALLLFIAIVGTLVSRHEWMLHAARWSPKLVLPTALLLVGVEAFRMLGWRVIEDLPVAVGLGAYVSASCLTVAGLGLVAFRPISEAMSQVGMPGSRALILLLVAGAAILLPYMVPWTAWVTSATAILGALWGAIAWLAD